MSITFRDSSKEFLDAFNAATERALEKCGLAAENFAVRLVPVDTGNLRNSITHKVVDDEVYIGTNNEYAAYVELGTGKYAEGGRKDPWVYQDEEGRWHHTDGQRARPYLKPAVADHKQTYLNIIKDELENA